MNSVQNFSSKFLISIENLAARSLDRCSDDALPFLMTNKSLSALDGLAARQASVLIQFTRNIGIWNNHSAPVLLRSMIECLITFCWICGDPVVRSESYVNYGIGQARHFADYYDSELKKDPENKEIEILKEFKIAFASSFRHLAFVDVNLGSWAGTDIRNMAKSVELEDLYRTAFSQFSAATHNTFYHVAANNLTPCKNKNHPNHLVKRYPNNLIDPDFLRLACKYFDRVIDRYKLVSKTSSVNMLTSRYFYRYATEFYNSLDSNVSKS